ncbi:MAG: tRNA-specific adenosine deaminase [Deltaproteobacteria bacterium]|nr:tRNA-specific adenosine deaminase [Deltaproteobacteria bacterium]
MKEQLQATSISQKDTFWMKHALALAQEAAQKGEVPVGAIVVYKDTIIGAAHNLRETHQDPIAHAEILAIKQASDHLGSWRLENCTLYVTLEPCPMCSGALWLSRIERCVFGCRDPKSGFLGSISNLMDQEKLNHHYEICSGVLENECSEILRTFFRRIRERKSQKEQNKI